MNLKRAIGISLIAISGIMGWSNTFTGAVVGVSSDFSLNLLTILIFIAGLLALMTSKNLNEIAREVEAEENKASPHAL